MTPTSTISRAFHFFKRFHALAPKAASNAIKDARSLTWTIRKRMHQIRLAVLCAGLFTSSTICVFFATLPLHPNADEIAYNLTVTLGYYLCITLNTGLAITAAAPLVGLALWNFGKGTRIVWGEDNRVRQLSAGAGPDIYIFSERPDEPTASVIDRKISALQNRKAGQYVFCVIFGERWAVVEKEKTQAPFTRDDAPFLPKPCPAELNPYGFGYDFTLETWGEYLQYLDWFVPRAPQYAKDDKIVGAKEEKDADKFDFVMRMGAEKW